jgi:cobalamin biosynthesis Mg chelatase CobN
VRLGFFKKNNKNNCMKDFNITDLQRFAALTFNYIDKDALDKLYRKYGDTSGEMTDFTLYQKLAHNPDFATDYAKLAKSIYDNRYFREDLRNGTVRVYGDGSAFVAYSYDGETGSGSSGSDSGSGSSSSNKVLGWLNSAFGWLGQASTIGINWYDRLSGNYSKMLDIQKKEAEAREQQQQASSTVIWIVGGVVVVIVVLILILKK